MGRFVYNFIKATLRWFQKRGYTEKERYHLWRGGRLSCELAECNLLSDRLNDVLSGARGLFHRKFPPSKLLDIAYNTTKYPPLAYVQFRLD
jgi:hypothetical protein